jgi:hypothetical protein
MSPARPCVVIGFSAALLLIAPGCALTKWQATRVQTLAGESISNCLVSCEWDWKFGRVQTVSCYESARTDGRGAVHLRLPRNADVCVLVAKADGFAEERVDCCTRLIRLRPVVTRLQIEEFAAMPLAARKAKIVQLLSGYMPGPGFDNIVEVAWDNRKILEETSLALNRVYSNARDLWELVQVLTAADGPRGVRVFEMGSARDRDVRRSLRGVAERFAQILPSDGVYKALSVPDRAEKGQLLAMILKQVGATLEYQTDIMRVFPFSDGFRLIRFSAVAGDFHAYLWLRAGPEGDIIVACDAIHVS